MIKHDLAQLHDCKQSQDKIVSVTIDHMGIERCGYCNKVVKYSEWLKNKIKLEDN